MKTTRSVLAFVLVLSYAVVSAAQDADTVIMKAVNAMGGEAAFNNIQSMIMTIKGEMMGSDMSMKMWVVKPDKMRMDGQMMGMDWGMGTDGQDYWINQGGMVMDMPEESKSQLQMQSQMFMGGGITALKEMGVTTEYGGMETVDGEQAEVLNLTYPAEYGGMSGKLYFKTADSLPFKMVMTTPAGEVTAKMSQYKEAGGIKYASLIEMDTMMGAMNMEITEFLVNTAIDASIFTRPQN